MFDTFNVWIDGREFKRLFLLNALPYQLTNVSEHKKQTGETWLSGNLKNYKVSFSDSGLRLSGSIAKYFLNDNLQTLNRGDTERALESLQDNLKISFKNAKVTRFDLGHNLIMRHTPESYFSVLGESQYFKRFETSKSLYYSNSNRVKIFYNKAAESKAKGFVLPKSFEHSNILRYEMRYLKRPTRQLKQTEITPALLVKEDFYIFIVNQWLKEFENINKINLIKMNLKKLKRQPTEKDFFDQLIIQRINEIGQTNLLKMVDSLKSEKIYSSPVNYSRIKRKIKELSKLPDLTEPSNRLNELSKKVNDIKHFYR